MISIDRLAVEGLESGCVTDNPAPVFSYSVSSDRAGTSIAAAKLSVGRWSCAPDNQVAITYAGPRLEPFTTYPVTLTVTADDGAEATAETTLTTGRLDTPWAGEWITDTAYRFTEKKVSPVPMVFRKTIALDKPVRHAVLMMTAMGIYEAELNGRKVGDRYFAPGFTSYKTHLQYQTYDVTDMLADSNDLTVTVAGGWAVGSFVFTRVNRVSADRQALLAELRVTFDDGSERVIGTDATWQVTEDGPFRMADLYDGETYDATVSLDKAAWRAAGVERPRVRPRITADYGVPVRAHETFDPIAVTTAPDGETIYDFGQNFAGVVRLRIDGTAGRRVTVRHAEILNPDGGLNVEFLRTAKATATYVCRDGEQEYSPRLTYMGFRYVGVSGIDPERVRVQGVALYSDLRRTGDFSCSDDMINQLQSNIVWGAKSNLMDIPTDCPQRDERMGWTGDIAVFSPTACYLFDMSRFLDKWLRDVKAEQLRTGGIPNTVPVQGYKFPATMPEMAIDWWGDACVLVPWAEYQARGDRGVLERMYPTMKKYVEACRFWAGLFGVGKRRYIWHTPAVLHFGDWVAPDVPQMSQWQKRSKWTATASLRNTSRLLSRVAGILGHDDDAREYAELSDRVADAYCSVLTDGNGRLVGEEFQTGYVLPLYLDMFPDDVRDKAVANLVRLIEDGDYRIGTGFPGTPYILFALADNGRADVAYRMLMNTTCPSWLYEVKMGATTIWERWDGLNENGVCPIGDDGTDLMISYNHYASGAVGAFLYQRVAGIEATTPGYRTFRVRPVPGGGLTWAKGSVETPYGRVSSDWRIDGGRFAITVEVPVGATCELVMPDGATHALANGRHTFDCACPAVGQVGKPAAAASR